MHVAVCVYVEPTALAALEQATGVKYDDDKPKRGSELLEVREVA